MPRLKVVHAIIGLGVGGAERMVLDLAAALAPNEVEIRVAAFTTDRRILRLGPVPAIPIEVFDLAPGLFAALLNFRRFVLFLRKDPPDVIHAHMFHGLLLSVLALPFCSPRPRLVFTSHNWGMASFARWAFVRLTRSLRAADIIFAADQHPKINARCTRIIFNGVAVPQRPGVRSMRRPGDPFRLLFVGRLHDVKDPVGLVEAFAAANLPNATLEFAGEGPQRVAVQAAIARHHLEDRVRLLGVRNDVRALIRRADAVLLHSTIEGQPVALLEAGAEAAPVISTLVGSVPQLLGQDRGVLAAPGDYPEALRRLERNPEDAAAMGLRLFDYVRDHCSTEAMAQAYLRLYLDVSAPRNTPSAVPRSPAMRILHVIASLNRGGAENHLRELIELQVAQGLTVACAYLKGDGYWVGDLRRLGCVVEPLKVGFYGPPGPFLRLRNLLASFKPDIVHAHLQPAELYATVALASSPSAAPLMISRHNCAPFYRGLFEHPIEGWVLRRTATVVAISEAVASHLAARHPTILKGRVQTIHYGLDVDRFRSALGSPRDRLRRQWGVGRDEVVVGVLSRLIASKRIDMLIDAYAPLRDHARLVVAGDGPERAAWEQRSQALGLADRVNFVGFRTDVADVMRAFDVFAFPSEIEGFGLVLLEAMASGLPIAAWDISPMRDIVQHGVTGLLAPLGDVAHFGTNLERLVLDPDLRRAMGSAGLKRVSKDFSTAQMTAAVSDLYAGLSDWDHAS